MISTGKSAQETVIDLEAPESWPSDVLTYLNEYHNLFLQWELGPSRIGAGNFDRAILAFEEILKAYALVGWHCSRLTRAEINHIIENGMQLPSVAMLSRRIDALVEQGLLTRESAHRLISTNQADERNRAGRIWFCFFAPSIGGQRGIERFFRHWGGEALYNSHEDNPEMSQVLGVIGTPVLVEARVPIRCLGPHSWLSIKTVRRFLISRGFRTDEPMDHEDQAVQPLAASNIQRIIRFPEPEFLRLTGCHEWRDPLRG
jgi:hypothetical protein